MSTKTPTICPACQGELQSTVVVCKDCGSQMTGEFTGCRFCKLSDEEEYFVAMFIKHRGSIKEMEKELGISYPTVKNKLNSIAKRLGLDNKLSKEELTKKRLDIINRLASGEIDTEQATKMIEQLTES